MPKKMAAMPISTRPTKTSLLLPDAEAAAIALPARIQPPPPKDISRKTIVHAMRSCGFATARGTWSIASNRNIMMPNSRPDQRTSTLVAMLSDAAIKATPTKYAQNKCHGT